MAKVDDPPTQTADQITPEKPAGLDGETGIATREPAVMATLGDWGKWLSTHGREELPTIDPSIIAERIMLRMLTAATPEEAFAAGGALSFEDLENVPVKVVKVYPMVSRFEKGPGVFMILDAINMDTGEAITITTGALNVMAFLCAAQDHGWVEVVFRVTKAENESSNGYRPYIVHPA